MAQDQPLQSQSQTVRIGLIGHNYGLKSSVDMDMTYWNCWPEIWRNPTTGEERHVLQKFPGFGLAATYGGLGAALVSAHGLTATNLFPVAHMAMSQMYDTYIAIIMDKSSGTAYVMKYSINGNTIVEIGSIAKDAALTAANAAHDIFSVYEVQIANAGTIYPGITINRMAYNRSVSTGWYARASGSPIVFTAASLNQIVAAAYPDQLGTPLVVTGPIIQMNGIFHVITTTGVIYSSNGGTGTPNDPTNWASTAVIQTYQDPDAGVALARYKHHIIAFSTNSIEFFNDEGIAAPASPLARTEQALVKFGANNPRCITTVGDSIYWVSYGRTNTTGIYKLDGYTPTKISTPKEDRHISGARTGSMEGDLNLTVFPMGAKTHLVVNGVYVGHPLYNSSSTLKWTSSSSVDNDFDYALRNNLIAGVMLYCIEDKIFWYQSGTAIITGSGIAHLTGILPAFPTKNLSASPSAADVTSILFTCNDYSSTSSLPVNAAAFAFQPIGGTGFGSFGNGNQWNGIPCSVTFNGLTFGNNKRKRINSAELVFSRNPLGDNSTSGGDYYCSLYWNKTNHNWITNDSSEDNWQARHTRIPAEKVGTTTYPAGSLSALNMQDRFYWSNLGMSRTWNFTVMTSGDHDFALEYLELDVSQGEH